MKLRTLTTFVTTLSAVMLVSLMGSASQDILMSGANCRSDAFVNSDEVYANYIGGLFNYSQTQANNVICPLTPAPYTINNSITATAYVSNNPAATCTLYNSSYSNGALIAWSPGTFRAINNGMYYYQCVATLNASVTCNSYLPTLRVSVPQYSSTYSYSSVYGVWWNVN